MSEEMIFLDLEKVDPPYDAFRDLIDPEQVRELAESIRSEGLLQPVLVRPFNGRFEIVVGHRRLLAHRLLGETKIKSLVRELSDEQVFVIRAIENDQREDLNPIEKGRVYKRLRDRFGWSNRTIAQKMGRSAKAVDNYFILLDLPEELQQAVSKKRLGMGVALCLNQIDDPEFQSFYFAAAIENGVTVAVAQGWVDDWKKSRAGIAYRQEGGGGEMGPVQESLPIYRACACCLGPEEVGKLKTLYVCGECERQVRGALKKG